MKHPPVLRSACWSVLLALGISSTHAYPTVGLMGPPASAHVLVETTGEAPAQQLQPDLASALEAESWATQMEAQPDVSALVLGLPVLAPGARQQEVLDLRQALVLKGFLAHPLSDLSPDLKQSWEPSAPGPDATWFDEYLERAVREAQRHYGLEVSGVASAPLYQKLAESDLALAQDLRNWAQALRRHAQVAREAGHSKLIVVNLASFSLRAIDLHTGDTLVESRVIVGKPNRRTPIFTTNITNLKYNPDWTPPPSLAAQGKRYTPAGPNNPLGRVRFSTDNNQNIYLHHTNEPDLFDRQQRALSSGCVRVERWDDLAAFVANSDVDWVHEQVARKKTHFEQVTTVPVVMAYSTADVTSGQALRFPDVYRLGSLAGPTP